MFRITRPRLGFAFWGFFILAAAFLIAGLITGRIVIDMLLAFIVIAIGFHGVLEEFDHRQSMRALRKVDESLRQLGEWIEKANLFMRSISERHELRIYNLDTKRSLAERKFERRTSELSKRIIETENKLNSVKKTVDRTGKLSKRIISLENRFNSVKKTLAGEKYKPLTSFEKRAAKAITSLRKDGLITTAVYSRKLRVSRSVARNDLKKMTSMKITRKRGKGRNIYYTLRF
jgi:hypothetical protein